MSDRRLLLRSWLFAMQRLELALRTEQARARNSMIRKAAKAYETAGHPPAHVFIAHRIRVRGVIESHYRRTIPVFAGMALKQVKSRKIEKKTAQTIYESLVTEWISREALRKATMIADTDRDDVLGAINTGMSEGLGTEEIARNIRGVSAQTPYRAATVARTETHAAATFGSIESVREAERSLGVTMMKEWLPTSDERTRPEHLAMASSDPIPMDEKFIVGGETMDRPGDTSASPENTINCRCALIYQEAT
jgi:uncharacterized protein with gpF-like domain